MRSLLDSLILQRTLAEIAGRRHLALGDLIESGHIEQAEENEEEVKPPLMRQLCFQVWPIVWQELDDVITMLGMSKRAFCEAAMVDAIERAKAIMSEEGFSEIDRQLGLARRTAPSRENGHD